MILIILIVHWWCFIPMNSIQRYYAPETQVLRGKLSVRLLTELNRQLKSLALI